MSNLANLLIVFIILIAVTMLWHQLFGVTPEESLVLTGVFIMLTVFGCGFFGYASIVFIIMSVLAVTAIICFTFDFSFQKKGKQSLKKRFLCFFSPSIVMICGIFVYCVIAFKGAIYTYPDELYQWGPAVRYMAETGNLPYGIDFTGSSITLSTATMFQYFWVGLNSFVERNSFVGNFILAFIPVFLPFSGKGWDSYKIIFLYTITLFLAISGFTYIKYYNLLQDLVLPLWAGSIIAWLFWKKEKHINWWLVLGSVACISAMKSMVGPLFAGIIILVIIIRQIVYYSPLKIKDICKIRVFIISLFTMISVFGINFIWSLCIGQNVNNRFIGYDSQAKNLHDIIRGIVNKSFSVINNGIKTIPNLSYFIMFFITLFFVLVLGAKINSVKEKRLFQIVFSLYTVGFLLYLGIMLYAYIGVFSAGDSESLAGLERYLSYYMLLGSVSIISLLYVNESMIAFRFRKVFQIGVIILLLFTTSDGFVTKVTTLNQKDDAAYKLRKRTSEQVASIRNLMDEEGTIFALGSISAEKAKILTYELGTLFRSDYDSLELYVRSEEDKVVLRDVLRYPSLLKDYGYKYLWIYSEEQGDEYSSLKYRYGMPDMTEGAFYKVEYSSDEISLDYLGNIEEMKQSE